MLMFGECETMNVKKKKILAVIYSYSTPRATNFIGSHSTYVHREFLVI